MVELIISLMLWITTVTGYPMPEKLPIIKYASPSEVYYRQYRCDAPTKHTKKKCEDINPKEAEKTLAIYNHHTDTIYLKDGLENMFNKNIYESIVVHELVHHMQYESDAQFDCLGQYEEDAYEIQDKFLLSRGENGVIESLRLNELYLMMIFQCNNPNEYGWGDYPLGSKD